MKNQTKAAILLFLAGFFAKDIIDCIFFLMTANYPLDVFGLAITASHHKIMLVISTVLTGAFLYFGLKKNANAI